MRTLHLNLSDDTARRLEALAREHGLSAEDIVRKVTEASISQQHKEFDEVVQHVLAKNQELYRRLAS